jgi:hypothetical protein
MTWTKLSDDFGDDCARVGLSDAAFRTHIEGLVWAMRRETGGYLDDLDIRRAIETENAAAAIPELLAVGFWVRERRGYRIVHAMDHQVEPEVIAHRRKLATDRKRWQRRRQAGLDD